LDCPADTAEEIFPVAQGLMKSLVREGILVRLIGVYGSNLEADTDGMQMPLFTQAQQKGRKLAAALDDITQRFGGQAVTRAVLVTKKRNRG
jgi:hypothetical protein